MAWILSLLILFFPCVSFAQDDNVKEEISLLKQRLSELERQGSRSPTIRGNEFNPRITAFGDFVGRMDNRAVTNDNAREISNRMSVREFELDFRGDVDPYARAVVIASIAQEEPRSNPQIDLEEIYATLTRMPRGMSLKAGKFKSAFGTMNRIHAHDLPQTTLPLPIIRFMGDEGMSAEGLSLNYLMPLQQEGQSFDVTMELFSAENTTLFSDTSARGLGYLLRGKYFTELTAQDFIEIGASMTAGRNGEANDIGKQATYLYGADFLYKWRAPQPKRLWSLVAQGEFFYMDREDVSVQVKRRNRWGSYGLLQIQTGQRWYVGGRYDVAQFLDTKTRIDRKIGGYVSFYTTEFLRFRVGYEYQNDAGPPPNSTHGADLSTMYAQMTFVFGSHPAEPYWVSR